MYHLFGSEDLTLESIFAVLLYSIAPIYIPPQVLSNIVSNGGFFCFLPCLGLKNAKDELPKYLRTPSSIQELTKLEAKLRLLKVEEKELETIPWYNFPSRFVIRKKYRSLRNEMVPIKKVFQYLEYLVQKRGMDLEKFYQQFQKFADGFPMNV